MCQPHTDLDVLSPSQGYGLTETCGATFVSHPTDPVRLLAVRPTRCQLACLKHEAFEVHVHCACAQGDFYTVGRPQLAFSMRLEAVPDMGYDPMGSPPRGEVRLGT